MYKIPDYALEDYLASYAGDRFWGAMAFIRVQPNALQRLQKRLPEFNVPCQITVGRHDPFVLISNAEGLKRKLPKSKLNVLECGHFVWDQDFYRPADRCCFDCSSALMCIDTNRATKTAKYNCPVTASAEQRVCATGSVGTIPA